jgi:hypothetical protein
MPTRGEPFALDPARSALLVGRHAERLRARGCPAGGAAGPPGHRDDRHRPGLDGHSNGAEQIAVRARDGVGFLAPCWPAWTGLGTLVNQTLTFVTNPSRRGDCAAGGRPAHGGFPYPAKRGRSRQGRRAQASGPGAPASHIPRRVCGRPRAARSQGTLVGGGPRVRAVGSAVAPLGGGRLGPQVGQPRQDGQSPRADRGVEPPQLS